MSVRSMALALRVPVGIVLAVVLISPAAGAPLTSHDIYRKELEVRRRSLVEGYQNVGSRNATWDDKARAFLEASAIALACDSVDPFYWPKDRPKPVVLLEQGDALAKSGCDDPLVLALACRWSDRYFRGSLRAHNDAMPPAATRPSTLINPTKVQGIVNALSASRYDDAIVAELMGDLGNRQSLVAPAQRKEYENTVNRRWIKAARPGAADRVRQRLVSRWGDRIARLTRPPINDPALGTLVRESEKELDPWVFHCLMARHLVEQAPLAPGVATQVMSPLQRKEFEQKLKTAVIHLHAARQLEPHLPEPAADMIVLSQALKDQGDPLDWFGHALAAQSDYVRAYEIVRISLQPKNGESYKPLLELATACLMQPRYDTIVPWQYVETVRSIGSDRGSTWIALQDPAICINVVKVLEGYIAQGDRKAYYLAVKAAVAFKCDQLVECRTALDQIVASGAAVDHNAFEYLQIPEAAIAIPAIFLRTGKQWNQVIEVKSLCREKKLAEALTLVRSVRNGLPADDPQLPALTTVVEDVEFLAGEWVQLRIPWSFNEDFYGFKSVEGDQVRMRPHGQPDVQLSLRGSAGEREKFAIWEGAAIGRKIPSDFEMEVHLEFADASNPRVAKVEPIPAGEPATLGVVFYDRATKHREYALADFTGQRAGFAVGGRIEKSWDAKVKFDSVLTVRCVNRRVTLFLDGKSIGEPHQLGSQFGVGFDVGIGGIDPSPVKVRKVRVRSVGKPAE